MSLAPLLAGMEVQPRPYQQRIITKAVDLFAEKSLRSILIDSPTGSGKTIMGLLIARALQERLGVRVGWVAMRRYLLAQARAENANRRIGVRAEFLSMFDRDPPADLDLLIVDEAQHDAAQSMAYLHQRIRPRFILGLSATPFRADRVKLCFDSVLKDAGIQTLIQDGYLSPYHHYTIPRHTPQSVVDFYLRDRPRWGKSILYFHTLDQCRTADRLLRAGGVRSEMVTGDSDREAQLQAFRMSSLDVLVNCMMLSEGFDCPELKTVFCRPSCKGVTIQMAGRVLRKHADLPCKQIVQCTKTRWPFLRTAAAALQYTWSDGQWRSLQANPFINQVNGRALQALAQNNTQLPAFLTRHQSRRRPRDRRRNFDESSH
ncbi:MAG TPA: DEAD/DEAH box helicase family protein [Gemmataceae bacterium]|nr:DEAD/DEAH box helicase family protein [Gemmataceae bacterium]